MKGLDLTAFPDDAEFVLEVLVTDPRLPAGAQYTLARRNADAVFSTFSDYNAFLVPDRYTVSHYLFPRPPRSLPRISSPEEMLQIAPRGGDVLFSRQESVELHESELVAG